MSPPQLAVDPLDPAGTQLEQVQQLPVVAVDRVEGIVVDQVAGGIQRYPPRPPLGAEDVVRTVPPQHARAGADQFVGQLAARLRYRRHPVG